MKHLVFIGVFLFSSLTNASAAPEPDPDLSQRLRPEYSDERLIPCGGGYIPRELRCSPKELINAFRLLKQTAQDNKWSFQMTRAKNSLGYSLIGMGSVTFIAAMLSQTLIPQLETYMVYIFGSGGAFYGVIWAGVFSAAGTFLILIVPPSNIFQADNLDVIERDYARNMREFLSLDEKAALNCMERDQALANHTITLATSVHIVLSRAPHPH